MDIHNIEVWGRSVDIDQFHPACRSEQLRRLMGLDNHFTFLYVGRLAAEKNVELVIEAFRRVAMRIPEKRPLLVIAGTGPQAEKLRVSTADRRDVRFLGNLDRHGMLPALYASADAFVYASETETLGLVVLEAMASGLPVIAAPSGGVRVNLRHLVNGLAFRPGDCADFADALERVICDDGLRKRLSAGARSWAELNSWDAELDRLDLSYREVMAPEMVRSLM